MKPLGNDPEAMNSTAQNSMIPLSATAPPSAGQRQAHNSAAQEPKKKNISTATRGFNRSGLKPPSPIAIATTYPTRHSPNSFAVQRKAVDSTKKPFLPICMA